MRDKRGIEIGGPSAVFRRFLNLPIYDMVGALDNCDFSQHTKWADHTQSYCFSKRKACGTTFVSEGSDLAYIPDNTYDFLLSSHNLEHFANPLRALEEWKRIVVPGGHLVIILPHYAKTFDHRRTPTTIEHMTEDYRNNVGEEDMTHVEETFAAHRLNEASRSDEELRQLLLTNFEHRMMHHHVFNETNSSELIKAAEMDVLAVENVPPFHIVLVAALHA